VPHRGTQVAPAPARRLGRAGAAALHLGGLQHRRARRAPGLEPLAPRGLPALGGGRRPPHGVDL